MSLLQFKYQILIPLYGAVVGLCSEVNPVISAIDQRGDRLSFMELAKLLGHDAEEYDVLTEDGYILGIHRIPGSRRPATLVLHGIELASDSWLLRGYKSLPIVLAERGHDLWFINVRGNIYSRRHVWLDPDVNQEFWDFSFHEYGYYDLPATIDTILNKTNTSQINAISYSQGTTMFSVLMATRPEFNDKVNFTIYMAPIAYLNRMRPPLLYEIAFSPEINVILQKLGMNECLGYYENYTTSLRQLCTDPVLSYEVCAYGFAFPVVGYDPEELEPAFYRISNFYFPVGSSRKNFIHYGQVGRTGKFAQYDYGPIDNVGTYNQPLPPTYDLSKVQTPVVMLVAQGDILATEYDAETLRDQLPNVKTYEVLPRKQTNHLDFIWGRNMDVYLYPYIFNAFGHEV